MTAEIFLSRNSGDKALSTELTGALQALGYRVRVQEHAGLTGESFKLFMDAALRECRYTVALLSEAYLGSGWCRQEAVGAIDVRGLKLIPLLVQEGVSPDGLLKSHVYLNVAGQTAQAMAQLIHEVIVHGAPLDQSPPARSYLRQSDFITNLAFNDAAIFKGRAGELARLRAALFDGSGAAAVVAGQGGVGKTALAEAYAREHRTAYRGVWRVNAETDAQAGLAELAAVFDPELAQAPVPQAAQAALQAIAQRGGRPFLLIYDNVTSPAAIASLRPAAGAHVLITSRFRDWTGHAEAVDLDVLPRADAAAVLIARAGRGTQEEAETLAKLLGDLPLALAHAGAALKREKLTSYVDYGADIARRMEVAPAGEYPVAVRATLESNLAQAEALSPGAAALLGMAAFLAPDAIPTALWDTEEAKAALPESLHDAGARAKAFGALETMSIIALTPDANVFGAAFSLHRMTQAVLRQLLGETGAAERTANAAGAAVDAKFPGGDGEDNPTDVRSWPRCAPLAPQAVALLDHDAAPSSLLNQAGLYFMARADYSAAEPLYRRALAINEASFGKDHPRVAIDLNNLAQLLKATNRLAEAEPLMRRALAIDEASFGMNHPEVATDLSNLATLLQAANRLAEAEPLMRRVIAIFETSFGKDHPNVAISLNNLALLLLATNRLAEAEQLMRRALTIDEASFGKDHPNVARDLNNLATLLQDTNRLAEAEPLMRRALQIDETHFGTDHPNVAIRLNNLAMLLQDTNRLAEAEPLAARAVRILEASLPDHHPWVQMGRANLAGIREDLAAAAIPGAAPPQRAPEPAPPSPRKTRWGVALALTLLLTLAAAAAWLTLGGGALPGL